MGNRGASVPSTQLDAPPLARRVEAPQSGKYGSGFKAKGKIGLDRETSKAILDYFQQKGERGFVIKEPEKELEVLQVDRDPTQSTRRIARVQQSVNGVPIFGGRATLVLQDQKGVLRETGNLTPTAHLAKINTIPTIDWLEAVRRAIGRYRLFPRAPMHCSSSGHKPAPCHITVQLQVFDPAKVQIKPVSDARLAWMVRLGMLVMFMDAHDGSLIYQYSTYQSASDRATYDFDGQPHTSEVKDTMQVMDENGPIEGIQPPDDAWAAHHSAARVYEFFKNLGRDSYDNNGAKQISYVRVDLDPAAMWDSYGMTYYRLGSPDAVDIAGHEYTHGVINSIHMTDPDDPPATTGEPGAVNEALADIFGAAVENKDWTIGEQLPDGLLRDMSDPHRGVHSTAQCPAGVAQPPGFHPNCKPFKSYNYGQPDHYTEIVDRTNLICNRADDCPHRNSGIINKAAYLASVGGNHHGFHVNGIQREKFIRILYFALPQLDLFYDMKTTAQEIVASCSDFVGEHDIRDADCNEVKTAFQAVGLLNP